MSERVLGPLSGRVAAITGASSGIGEATALALAGAGAAVALAARRADRMEALADRIRTAGGTALVLPTDVSVEQQSRAFIASTVEQLGGLDVLVNNAGMMRLGMVTESDTDEWRQMIDVNLYGVLYCSHAALPILTAQGSGHIVNVSSIGGRRTSAGRSIYALTKHGVNGFSESLRQEAARSNVRVTVIMPGFVETEINGPEPNEFHAAAAKAGKETIGKGLESADVANAILYAVSQPAHVVINEILMRPIGQQN
jgi:NADP-dependent 3-hydroxy acid dehydrogenase YdfG